MITLDDIHLSYGESAVLRGLSLHVPKGQSVAIIGRSGTGKSAALRCILGLERPDQGRILIDGQEAKRENRDSWLPRIGMLFQGAALFDSLTVWQNVAFRLLHGRSKRPRSEARDLAVEKLLRVGLMPDVADLYPAELSGGMQKRVGLARAIAIQPEIMLFDEPTTGLDPITASVINRLIREIVTEMGATAITITHDMPSVRIIADDVALLHGGRLHWSGPVAQLDTSGDPFLEQFVHGRATGPIRAMG
ncbi:ABC transporter ATP-binding protein [Lutimaribacter marinistellae]|uniref:ABC transporter ATP-binding protein n=1 Tax=Lutimaribacter marinistellae TaxID=1820329 RepID=A0ABV7TLF5_9RHOB